MRRRRGAAQTTTRHGDQAMPGTRRGRHHDHDAGRAARRAEGRERARDRRSERRHCRSRPRAERARHVHVDAAQRRQGAQQRAPVRAAPRTRDAGRAALAEVEAHAGPSRRVGPQHAGTRAQPEGARELVERPPERAAGGQRPDVAPWARLESPRHLEPWERIA